MLNFLTFAFVAVLCLPHISASAPRRNVFLYVDESIIWSGDFCQDLEYIADSGVSHIILAFWFTPSRDGPKDSAYQWASYGAEHPGWQEECLEKVHSKGSVVLVSAGGGGDNTPTENDDPEVFAEQFAQFALDNHLDGIDFDLEGLKTNFGDTGVYDWFVKATRQARQILDSSPYTVGLIPRRLLTHAPQAPYLGSWAGSNLGFVGLLKDTADDVDYLLVQFYDQGVCSYDTYESLFKSIDCWAPDTTWSDFKKVLTEEELAKIVVGKLTFPGEDNTGYVPPEELAKIICQAEEELGYSAGVMGWDYGGVDELRTKEWMQALATSICGSEATTPQPPKTTTSSSTSETTSTSSRAIPILTWGITWFFVWKILFDVFAV